MFDVLNRQQKTSTADLGSIPRLAEHNSPGLDFRGLRVLPLGWWVSLGSPPSVLSDILWTPFFCDHDKKNRVKCELMAALQELEEKDHCLLAGDAHERSIVHRLACYLEGRFDGYSVDVEYNRQGDRNDPKRVERPRRRRFPDIVAHERGTDKKNLLAIECKKSSNRTSRDADKKTLEDLKFDHDYKYAVFIEIQVGKDPAPRDRFSLEWI